MIALINTFLPTMIWLIWKMQQDTSGRTVWTQHVDANTKGIEIENLKSGFYILHVVTGGKRMISKIIVE